MLATIRNYPRTVNLLLSATLLLTLAKAITFPYLVIYLTRHFGLDITQVGLVIGSSLIVGSLLSVYGDVDDRIGQVDQDQAAVEQPDALSHDGADKPSTNSALKPNNSL